MTHDVNTTRPPGPLLDLSQGRDLFGVRVKTEILIGSGKGEETVIKTLTDSRPLVEIGCLDPCLLETLS